MAYSWLPHLENSIPTTVSADKISMYTIALEGWRRGLPLKFFTVKYGSRVEINYSFYYEGKEYKFAVSKGEEVTKEAMRISKDKYQTKEVLLKENVPVPKGRKFEKDAIDKDIIEFANNIDYPLVLKPTNANLGRGVIPNIKNKEELAQSLKYVRRELNYPEVIVEEYIEGEEYRIYVIDGEVIGAMNRIPANITGDGKKTIRQLITQKNNERRKNPNLRGRRIKIDKEVRRNIEQAGYTLNTILDEGEKLFLRENSNLSSGGDSVDVTDQLTDELKDIAIRATEAIPGLVQCGVDVIINKEKNTGAVIEVNTRPGIGGHLFPQIGKARDIPKAIIDYYFPKTKGQERNDNFYFDYKSIKSILNSGISTEVIVPPVPTEAVEVKRLQLDGQNIDLLSFKRWVQRQALSKKINGFIKSTTKNSAMIIAAGTKGDINRFIECIQKESPKKVLLEIKEKEWTSPIKMGFEIRKTSFQQSNGTKKLKVTTKNKSNNIRNESYKGSLNNQMKQKNKSLTFQQKLYRKYGNTMIWKMYKQIKALKG